MHRPRHLWLLCPVLVALVFAAGCSSAPEEQMVRKFFQSSRLGDNMTLASIATVSFDPSKDGQASSVKVVSVTPEESRPLQFKELEQARKAAADEEAAFSKKMKEYQDQNIEAINRVLKIEATNGKARGKDAEVQAAWSKYREEQAVLSKKVSEARQKLNRERRVADLSVSDHDPTTFDATEFKKEVTVTADVQMPNGQTDKKTMVLTMQRVVLKDPAGGKDIEGRWMITHIADAAAPKG
jgi:hypothetical protein